MKTCLKVGLPDGFYFGSPVHYWVSLGKLLNSVSWYIKQGPRWTTCSSLTGTYLAFSSIQLLSCLTFCNPIDCGTTGFPVHHQLPGLVQNHVHWSRWRHSHLLLPSVFPSIRVFPMSQFFESGGQSIGASTAASVIPMNMQDWFSLGLTGLVSLQSKGLSRVFSNATVQKHQFFNAQLSL